MFDQQVIELDWGGRTLRLETGKVARQADGAVVASYGETTVLATVVSDKEPRPGLDFLPLTVNYQERYYAAGRIPGGFFKREGRPTEKETLTSRLIDRPIRPLFADSFRNETQVLATVLSHDMENDPDIVAMIGCSAALTISGIPFMGPIGAARVGYKDGRYLLNPTASELQQSKLDLVVAGTQDAVLMVESEADRLSEDDVVAAATALGLPPTTQVPPAPDLRSGPSPLSNEAAVGDARVPGRPPGHPTRAEPAALVTGCGLLPRRMKRRPLKKTRKAKRRIRSAFRRT